MREDPPKSQTVAEERKLDNPGNAFSPLIYSPCVPVLLEEIASLLFPPSSSPSSSSSAFSSQGGERRSQLSPFQRLKTVPAAVPACNLLSVRVFGTACCMLASSRWLLLAGLVDSAKTLIVDLSALSPSVVAATCEAVEAARRRDLETESERQEADIPVERAEPVFQFLGDAVPLAFSALSTEDRLAVLRHRGPRPKSRPGKREGEEDSEERDGREHEDRDAEGLDEQSESQQGRETQREEREEGGGDEKEDLVSAAAPSLCREKGRKGGGERRRDPRKPKRQETTEGEKQIGLLKARMCRRVDGIDVEAYMTSLYLFRKMQRDAKTQT
ncbi:hypothetical protein TGCAST_299172 [Toxoplasma gondii CAST]|uniref:Uncharacterized protein n=1 Tax=Toxoplasma gondii CAST TaxID=943122 RepID=A0A3R8BQM1_TOXGO|nr:hypothetical protein TGCAST_299172 [Toxoplasma gondii CAST]